MRGPPSGTCRLPGTSLLPLVLAVFALSVTGEARSQAVPRSQHATVSQMVGRTEIAVSYSRPVARGRVLFGDDGVVHWGRVWTPGADSATRISFSRDVLVEGKEVKQGSYSVWLVPRDGEFWGLILSRAAHVWHIPYPGDGQDALRADVRPESGSHMEVLALYFPIVAPDSAVLRIHWGETVVPVRIRAPLPGDGR